MNRYDKPRGTSNERFYVLPHRGDGKWYLASDAVRIFKVYGPAQRYAKKRNAAENLNLVVRSAAFVRVDEVPRMDDPRNAGN